MTSLSAELTAIAQAAFAAEGLSPELGVVQISDRPDLAQFQCNGALPAAKAAKQNPRAIAEKIAARLKENPIFAKVEIAGPGFINLDVTDDALAVRLGTMAKDARLGAPETGKGKSVVIDFGGANVAKPMHVGHLRSSVIGDSLQRLFRANGWQVTSDVHLGDWGLQMGQLISEIEHRKIAPVYFDANFKGPYPEQSPVTMDDLEEIYPAASAACKADPARLEEARKATAELQAGRPGYRALWEHFFAVSRVGLEREWGSLGVHFDLWKGEASVEPLIAPMIAALKAQHITEVSDGALVIPVALNSDKKEMPPLILVKSDGAVLYGTTDLATIVDRVKEQNPDLILYVVDQRQHLHFEQVYRAARKAHLNGKAELEHAGFGTMNGPDGKPFKTRAGGVMKLFDLIAMVTEEAQKRLTEAGIGADYPPEERAATAKMVGIATLKFADLSNHRQTDYIFDLARFSKFEGKTGPYLQYAAVRMQSILRKADPKDLNPSERAVLRTPEDRALILQLLALPDAMTAAEEKRAPNILCDYAFNLAQEFSRFYSTHHILSETDATLRATWLGLCGLTLATMTKVLDLLGIEIPPRM
ncbi:MAG: arginine--tRNA ligase [Proteobacteria bacterium]|nr:arginine--tRNA ligase [Pseudomonadota bacterium]